MIIPSKHCGYGEGGRLTSTRRVYDSGGSNTQTQVADLPDWAKGAAQRTLGLTESTLFKKNAAGDITGFQPYQAYGGERTAQFTPLQQQAYGNAYGMNAGPEGFAQNVGTYMSPYQQNVIDREKMEAARASQMLGQQQQGQATQAGAFGGYREGIQRAERERGLRSQLQDIQTRGSQAAYDRAADQFRSGVTQQLAVGQQQQQFGTQQQQAVQSMMDKRYQDFLAERQYPYQQLEFMSNILRGTPMGMTNTLYGANPTIGQQIGALGMGAYGLSKMAAAGGVMESYADGGVTSDQFVESAIRRLSDAQLQQEMQEAAQAQDQDKLAMLQSEASRRAQAREGNGGGAGLSSLFSEKMADNVMPTEESMARGGIVAFAGDDEENDEETGQLTRGVSEGNPDVFKNFTDAFPRMYKNLAAAKYVPMSDADYNEAIRKRREMLEDAAGPSPYAELRNQIAEMQAEREGNLSQSKGLAALQAAGAMLQGRGLARGIGQAGSAFASSYGQALQADKAEKRAITSMKINLADAERKERMGLTRDAIGAADQARRDHAAAQDFALKKSTALANMAKGFATVTKPTKPGAAPKVPERLADALEAYKKDPSPENKNRVDALERAAALTRTTFSTSEVGPTRADLMAGATDAGTEAKILKYVDDNKLMDKDYRDANRMPAGPAKDAAVAAALGNLRKQALTATGKEGAPARAPAPNVNSNSTPRPNSATVQGLPAGATVRGNEVFDSTGKLIGHIR